MLGIMNERQITEEEAVQLELEELAPEKFDPEFQFKLNKQHSDEPKESYYRPLNREETAALLAASRAKYVPEEPEPTKAYRTYSREQIEAFMTEHYAYKKVEKKEKEEEKWEVQKTTVSEVKTAIKMKRGKSTKKC